MKPKTGLLLAGVFAAGCVLGVVLTRLNQSQPAVASTTGTNISDARAQRTSIRTSGQQNVVANPDYLTALEAISGMPRDKRWDKLREIARSVPAGEEAAALTAAHKLLNFHELSNFRWNLIQAWAERDYRAVIAYSETLKDRNERNQAQQAGLFEWAKADPEGALAWLESQPRGQNRQMLQGAIIRGIAQNDPEKALQQLEGAGLGERRWIRNEIISALAETKPQIAAELAL